MDLKKIQEYIEEIKESSIAKESGGNVARAQLLGIWAIAEQLAISNDALYHLIGSKK